MSEPLAIDTNTENEQSSEQSTTPVLTLEETKYALQQLFGAMFSRPILSQIPIAAILKIPEVVALSTDEVLIRELLGENKNIIVTNEFIKSSIKPEQNTIILRDIPSSTPTEEIIDIIKKSTQNDGSPCPPLLSIRADTNDTWFVTFATESEARSALQAISNAKFNEDKIRARLKTESLVKYQSSGPNFIPANNNVPHIVYSNNNPNIPINNNMPIPGGIYYNPVGNFPVVSPPNLMNAGPQWNVIPPPGYVPNPGTAAFMAMSPGMNGFIQQGPPKQHSPSHNRNYNKANNQRNRFNRNNSNNNLNTSTTSPPVQPVVVAIPQTGSPSRYSQNPPPNARQFNENGPSPDNYSPRSNSNNNVTANENIPYYYRNQGAPIHPMNEYIDVGNGYVIPAYQVPIQLYQQHPTLQQMQFHQFQIQQQAQAQAAHLMQQPVAHTVLVDNNRAVDSPRGIDSPRPNYIYFAGRTEPNNNSNPSSTTNKNSSSSTFKNDDNLDANSLNQAPAADNTTSPTQQQTAQLPTQSYRQKKDKSNYSYNSQSNEAIQSKTTNNIGTNVTYTNTSDQSNANSTTGNNYSDKDKYRNNNRDSRRKPNNITNSSANSNTSNRIRSDDRRTDKAVTKVAPKFNLEYDFPTLIDGEAAPVSNSGNASNDTNSGYAAALKRTVNVETKLDHSNNNAINNHINQTFYPLDSHIDEKNSVITASTDDDDLIVPPQYKQAWGLKKAANKVNKKNSIDTVEPTHNLPISNNNESNAEDAVQGFLAFGSFNPVLPDTNVKTVYGASKSESTTVSPKSSNENKSNIDHSRNTNATPYDNQNDNSNSKRSFLDALKSKS